MIRTLIVDDEPLARSRVRAMLSPHSDIEIIAECSSAAETSALLQSEPASLLMLDVEMPAATGFDFLETLSPEKRPAVVFVTAHEEFALDAFDANAVDYLVKPFSQERLDRALWRVRRFIEGKAAARPAGTGVRRARERLAVRVRGEVVFVKVSSIDWVAAAGNYVRLHAGNESYLLRESMQNIAAELEPSVFLRVHRSAIVNIERVRKLIPAVDGSLSIVLQNSTTIPLGPTSRAMLEEALGETF
jgi:two-component system LytT family response regulator